MSDSETPTSRFQWIQMALTDIGSPLQAGATVLDFGAGDGQMAYDASSQGFDAYACDFPKNTGPVHVKSESTYDHLRSAGRYRDISPRPYRLPFDDETFDLVVSDQVLEHVNDYPTTLAELRRVSKVNGVFLHIFPSRYSVIEPHVFVPGATVLRARWWLFFWACLGVRNQYQSGLSAHEVASQNIAYLDSFTNYLPPAEIKRQFGRHFRDLRFVESEFLAYSSKGKYVKTLGLSSLYGALRDRYFFGRAA